MSFVPDSPAHTGGKGADRLVSIGVAARPHGVRGELRIHLYNPDSRLLKEAAQVFIVREGKAPERAKFRAVRFVDKAALVFLEGVADRDAADLLRGAEFAVPRSAMPAPEEGEVYLVDLIGLEARGPNGFAGKVTAIFEYPSVDCIEITSEDGLREVPLLPGRVLETNPDEGYVVLGEIDDIPVRSTR